MSGLLSSWVDGTRTRLVAQAVREGSRVLDIGCGNGLLIRYLPRSISYVGVDINQEIIQWLSHQYPSFKFFQCRAGLDPLPSGPFDVVTLAGFIEHIDKEFHLKLLENIRKVLAPDSVVVLTTPTVFGGHFHKWLSKIGLVSREAAEEHKGFLSTGDLQVLFEMAGFSILKHCYYFMGSAHYILAQPR